MSRALFYGLVFLANALAIAWFYGEVNALALRTAELLDAQALHYAHDIAACRLEVQQCRAEQRGGTIGGLSAMPLPLPQPSGRVIM